MKRILCLFLVVILLAGTFIFAIYLDVPNYISFYSRPNENIFISTHDDKDYSKATGLFEYVLKKNENNWENSVPDSFYMQLSGEKNISIRVSDGSQTKMYEYNPVMGIIKLNNSCLYLKGGDKVIFNLLY